MAKKKSVKTKASKKSARKDPETGDEVPEGQLADWGDKVSNDTRKLAARYDECHTKESRAKAATKGARDALISNMIKEGVTRCPIRNGEKFLELDTANSVKYRVPKDNKEE